MNDKKKSVLEQLFPNYGSEKFLSEYWPDKYLFDEGDLDRFDWLKLCPELSSINKYFAHLKKIQRKVNTLKNDTDGWFMSDPQQAEQLFKSSAAYFVESSSEHYRPGLKFAFDALRQQLGLILKGYSQTNLYFGGATLGLDWHYDKNANFAIQLVGEKRWKVAYNYSIVNPLQNYDMERDKNSRPDIHPKLKTEPEEYEEIILKPGSTLFMP